MESQVSTGAPPGTRTPNPRIKSPLLSSMLPRYYLRLRARTSEDMPLTCKTAYRIMTADASPYRGIRATTEQPSVCTGLDHHGRRHLDHRERGHDHGRHRYRSLARRNMSATIGVRRKRPTRFVIPAGSAQVNVPDRFWVPLLSAGLDPRGLRLLAPYAPPRRSSQRPALSGPRIGAACGTC
jgi:hypothetical protein